MTSSNVTSSEAVAYASAFYAGYARGGAIDATGGFSANSSTISGNIAKSANIGLAIGGGLYLTNLRGDVSISDSTISGNTALGTNSASGVGGGLMVIDNAHQGVKTTISNSTISNNSSTNIVGGLFVATDTIVVRNSTISHNTALATASGPILLSAGLTVNSAFDPIDITLQSTIIANNVQGSASPYASDFSAAETNGNSITIAGSNNLVMASSAAMPADTITGTCPLLGPLRDNGGPTETRALLSNSPAIDSGNNNAGLLYDQRGFPRVSGSDADIGAYELDQSDVVFNSNFDGCL